MILDNLTALIGSMTAANAIAGQLVTSLGSTVSTNTVDVAPLQLNQNADLNRSDELGFNITLLQTLTSAGAATVRFALITADDATLTTNVQVICQTDNIPFATLTAGRTVQMLVNNALLINRRYLGALITIGTAVLTNAQPQFFGALTPDLQSGSTTYNNGFRVF